MSDWLAPVDIAGLPGVPSTVQGITSRARRDAWRSRPRQARGGGREYHVSSLPSAARAALAAHQVSIAKEQEQAGRAAGARERLAATQAKTARLQSSSDGLARLATLDGSARTRAEARLAILDAVAAFSRRSDQSLTAAMTSFVAYYNDGAIDVADWVREHVSGISVASLHRWRKAAREGGAARLSGQYGNRAGSGKIDSQREIREFAEAMIAEHPHLRCKALYRGIVARFSDRDDIKLPSQTACERWLRRWKDQNKSLYLSISNPDRWNSKYRPAFGSASEDIERINQRWELDSTPADLMLTDGRYHLVGVIDIYTRRLRMVVSKTSTAQSVASVFRRAVLDWGVPESVKIDNGSDYTSNHVSRIWDFFGIEALVCNPYSGWEKPHIERAFGTFTRDLIELAPGYCGHSVADRQAIESQATFAKRLQDPDEVFDIRMSSTELQAFIDQWLADIYERELHSALGCTPAEKAAGQRVQSVEDERVLDILLSRSPDGSTRTVQKKGISVGGYQYIHAALADERVMGEPVQVLFDEHDMGRLYCFADLGAGWEFLCVAECPEITGISRQAVAAEVLARNDRAVRDARAEMNRAKKRHRTKDVVDDILDHAHRNAGRVAHMPGRRDAAESEGLSAAANAITAIDAARQAPAGPAPIAPETRRELRQKIDADTPAEELTPRQQFRAWQSMIDRTLPGDDEREEWRIYETSIAFAVRYEAAYDAEFTGHGPGQPHESTSMRRVK